MPSFDAFNLIKWMHFVALSVAAGGAVTCLLVSGFEESREDPQGFAAALWSRVVRWAFRIALLAGVALIGYFHSMGVNPFIYRYLWIKLPLALLAIGLSEMTPRALASGRRGSAMLTLLLFLLASFVAFQQSAFGARGSSNRPAITSQK